VTRRFDRVSRETLDGMNLATLCAHFDLRCSEAREHGLWLFEWDPDFSAYAMVRIPELADLGSGVARARP